MYCFDISDLYLVKRDDFVIQTNLPLSMCIPILGPLLWAIPSLYIMKWELFLPCSGEEIKLSIDLQAKVPLHQPCLWFTWVQDAARGRTVSSLGDSELPLCCLQMIWFCSLNQIVTCMCSWMDCSWDDGQHLQLWGHGSLLENKGFILWVGTEILHKMKEFNYLWVFLMKKVEFSRRLSRLSYDIIKTFHLMMP